MRPVNEAVMADGRGGFGPCRIDPIQTDKPFGLGTGFGWLGPIVNAARIWLERHRQRRALNLLEDKMLKDVGLTRLDVEREIRKPFWQA